MQDPQMRTEEAILDKYDYIMKNLKQKANRIIYVIFYYILVYFIR